MAWNDTFTAATDWSDVAFVQMFIDAVNDRIRAYNEMAGFEAIAEFDDVSVGDDVQAAIAWSSSGTTFNWRALQEAVHEMLDVGITGPPGNSTWSHPDDDVDGTTGLTPPDFGWAEALANAGLNAGGFTSKSPREIANTSAAGSSGQIARALDDGKVYKHDGSSWVRWTADPPDLLTAYGFMSPGDYIGPWVFNELRDMINQMWRIQTFASSGTLTSYNGSGSDATWANAKTAADANFPSGAGVDTTGPLRYTRGYNGGSFFADTYTGQAAFSVSGMLTTVTHDVTFLARATAPSGGAFSALGDGPPWVEDTWKAYQTVTGSTAASVTSNNIGTTTKAATWAAEPTSGNYTYLGYIAASVVAVIEYDFQYGPA